MATILGVHFNFNWQMHYMLANWCQIREYSGFYLVNLKVFTFQKTQSYHSFENRTIHNHKDEFDRFAKIRMFFQ